MKTIKESKKYKRVDVLTLPHGILDWLVAKKEGYDVGFTKEKAYGPWVPCYFKDVGDGEEPFSIPEYTVKWKHCGKVLHGFIDKLEKNESDGEFIATYLNKSAKAINPKVAICQAIVLGVYGDTVSIPVEFLDIYGIREDVRDGQEG